MRADERARGAVDIVVPIYNGYEDLLLCLASLQAHTDLARHRLILIDDKSPDPRIRPYLEGLSRKPGICVLFNEKNQGFSANANRGLAYSDRDTILLNSDTIVTDRWVEKLERCAYSVPSVATVTPLSNAATLASVPEFLQDNPLPEGYSVDDYADLVEKRSLRHYPEITVGVGFCLYICQEAYRAVGPFDAKTFGRGYGEENDFCNRCGMLGYRHLLCDDTFIYHKGTASFDTDQKRQLCRDHDRILRSRYPVQMEANDAYCAQNPDSDIRDNLKLYMQLKAGRRNLLYFLHLDFQGIAKSHIGGTQLHVRDLVLEARKDFNVFVTARDGADLRLTIYPQGESDPIFLKFPIGERPAFPVFHDQKLAGLLRQILTVFGIDLVHVHHTDGLTLDIFEVCHDLKIPVLCTLHDYYYACPTVKLLDGDGAFCPNKGRFAPADDSVCRKCLHRTLGYGHVSLIDRWREENGRALDLCSKIIFPSESAEAVMLAAFPGLKGRSMVIPHGTGEGTGTVQLPPVLTGRAEAVKSPDVHSSLDQLPGKNGGFNYLTGWAYLEGEESRKVLAMAEITDRRGQVFRLPLRKVPRRDLADQTGDRRTLYAGFHTVFDLPHMADGRYRLRVLLGKDGGWQTDGKTYTGTYQKIPEASAYADPADSGVREPAGRDRIGRPGKRAGDRPLHVAFLGGVTPAKGSKVLSDMIHSGRDHFRFFVFGQVGDPEVCREPLPANVSFSGVYDQEDVGALLASCRIDLACILPIWGETFCYTVSEAWAGGIPVLGTDIGAVGERIRRTGAGWTLPAYADADQVLDFLEHLRKNPARVEKKRQAAAALRLKTLSWMGAEYRTLYLSLLPALGPGGIDRARGRYPVASAGDLETIFQGYASANPRVGGRRGEAEKNRLREENAALRSSIEMMKNTISYKMARKIADANLPGKEALKSLLRKKES